MKRFIMLFLSVFLFCVFGCATISNFGSSGMKGKLGVILDKHGWSSSFSYGNFPYGCYLTESLSNAEVAESGFVSLGTYIASISSLSDLMVGCQSNDTGSNLIYYAVFKNSVDAENCFKTVLRDIKKEDSPSIYTADGETNPFVMRARYYGKSNALSDRYDFRGVFVRGSSVLFIDRSAVDQTFYSLSSSLSDMFDDHIVLDGDFRLLYAELIDSFMGTTNAKSKLDELYAFSSQYPYELYDVYGRYKPMP